MSATATRADLALLRGLPHGDDGPVFAAPWQAQAFALTLSLHERGVFTWSEWAHTLSQAITRAQAGGDADLGDTYYQHWLDALERLLIDKGLAGHDQIHAVEAAWAAAAARTPHGQPIQLNEDELAQARAHAAA
jgi:nitrile hydratase accessory protein